MSDIEPTNAAAEAAVSHRDISKERGAIDPVRPEREGLPRGYRMRADTHYVDHLGSQSSGQPVRLVDVDQIVTFQACEPAEIRLLIESIRTHGIVHPLLIARKEAGYAVIAGHKRLAAARLLRLPAVPCLVHAVDQAQAALLARADNLQAAAPVRMDAATPMAAEVRQAIAQHLSIVQSGATLIQSSPRHLARATVDLVSAHAWRAARLIDALDALDKRPARGARMRSLTSVIDRIVDGFAAEGRLNAVDVRARFDGAAAGAMVDDHEVSVVVSSGVLGMLPTVDQADMDRPAIVVTASGGADSSVRMAIAQTAAPTPPALAARFFDEAYSDRVGGWCAVACARAVKAVAERAGGSASFEVDSQGHSSLVVQLPCA